MTRLVSARVLCDSCLSAQARVYCVSVRRALCTLCSQTLARHSRAVDLARTAAALPLCDRCDAMPAIAYSPSLNCTFCGSCNVTMEQESVESESDCKGAAWMAVGRGARRRPSQDIVLAVKQRSVCFTGPGPPQSNLAGLASSQTPLSTFSNAPDLAGQKPVLNTRHPSRALPAYVNCSAPLYGHGSAAVAAAAAASAAAASAATARLLAGGPHALQSASPLGTASASGCEPRDRCDPTPFSAGDDLHNMSQYFYIAHYQQQRLHELYLHQMQEEAAAAAAAAATTGQGNSVQRDASCADAVVPGQIVSGMKKEQLVEEASPRSGHVVSLSGKRSRSPPNSDPKCAERASAVRKIGGSGDFLVMDGPGDASGEGSGGSGGGGGSDRSADEQRDVSADGSGSSRRSDIAAPLGAANNAVLTAAAVAAAGEMYLLNSLYPDSSNESFVSPHPEIDPAGLLTAANIAAAGASAAIAADAAAANAAAVAAVCGSQPKRERAMKAEVLGQGRTGLGDRCSSIPSSSNAWIQSENAKFNGNADIASNPEHLVSSMDARASKRSSVPCGSEIPASMVGSSVIGAVAGSLDEGGMPDVSGFDENLDFSAFDSQQPSSLHPPRSLRLDSPREASDV